LIWDFFEEWDKVQKQYGTVPRGTCSAPVSPQLFILVERLLKAMAEKNGSYYIIIILCFLGAPRW
jgi:hypothetical protein